MTIFAVINQPGPNSAKLSQAVEDKFPGMSYKLDAGVWLVSAKGTAESMSNELGITPGGENGLGLVLEVGSYFGRANPAIWTWMRSNWETANRG